jgi:hypothetical protein
MSKDQEANRLAVQKYRSKKSNQKKETRLRKARIQRSREWIIEFKKVVSCENCGEDRYYCLDFHHQGDKKSMGISEMVHGGYSRQKMLAEIKKCKVVCKNCHAEIHFNERTKK